MMSQNRHIDQRGKVESPELNPHTYSQLILDKGGRNIPEGKTISLASGVGKTGVGCHSLLHELFPS